MNLVLANDGDEEGSVAISGLCRRCSAYAEWHSMQTGRGATASAQSVRPTSFINVPCVDLPHYALMFEGR